MELTGIAESLIDEHGHDLVSLCCYPTGKCHSVDVHGWYERPNQGAWLPCRHHAAHVAKGWTLVQFDVEELRWVKQPKGPMDGHATKWESFAGQLRTWKG